jgi:hypothetical protein
MMMLKKTVPVHKPLQNHGQKHVMSFEKFFFATGWQPKIPLSEGLSRKFGRKSRSKKDAAQVVRDGGVDLRDIPMARQADGALAFQYDPAIFKDMSFDDVMGFKPVIIDIKPVGSLDQFLGRTP